jgi:hypothetical protein
MTEMNGEHMRLVVYCVDILISKDFLNDKNRESC